jgi:hypothetical protein
MYHLDSPTFYGEGIIGISKKALYTEYAFFIFHNSQAVLTLDSFK